MTTQQAVAQLNEIFGNPKGDITSVDINAARKQGNLVLEEAIELFEALNPHVELQIVKHVKPDEVVLSPDSIDHEEVLDAIGDGLTVLYGMGHVMGVDSDAVYNLVHASNLTKLLANQDEANAALQVYYDMGIDPEALEVEGEYPEAFIRVVADAVDVDGKFYPKGKFLKNLPKFKAPCFKALLPQED